MKPEATEMDVLCSPSLQAVVGLLAAQGLPTDDITPTAPIQFFGCGVPDAPCGVIGLECHGSQGLLRSLLVTEAFRGRGVGQSLVKHVEAVALAAGITDLYLLTETAEKFFDQVNYENCARERVPESIRNSSQFSRLCPESAVVMRKKLSLNTSFASSQSSM